MTQPNTQAPADELIALAKQCGARVVYSVPRDPGAPQRVTDIQMLPDQFAAFCAALASQPAQAETAQGRREVEFLAALQKAADEWGFELEGSTAFFCDALKHWHPSCTDHVLIPRSELIERDSYGVYGSDFSRCKLCGGESGAGFLNKGIQHVAGCYLTGSPEPAAPTPPQAQPAPNERVAFGESLAALLSDVRDWFEGEWHQVIGVVGKSEVQGDLQHDDTPATFDQVYVNQGGGGLTGDDFHGDAYFHIGHGQYLKTSY